MRLSIVMSTYNRGRLLADAIGSVLAQQQNTPAFELIVVDNNSTDATREIVEQAARGDHRVRYAFEPRQGLSYARNTGIAAARAGLVAFTDDDVRVEPDWVAAIVRAFDEHPEADLIGGRVLPIWPSAPAAWLTRDHWAPLALVDHGHEPIAVTTARPICLIGANVAFRREVFDAVGEFGTDFQRVGDRIGSLEDHEFQLRLLRIGRTGLYDPRIVVHAEIQPNRLDAAYHRRWHAGHGHFHSLLRSEDMERTRRGTLLGVPLHLYRQAVRDAIGWVGATLRGDSSRAFTHELRLRFFNGFFQTRRREYRSLSRHERQMAVKRMVPDAPQHQALTRAETRGGEEPV
ncbi:MAG: glucosyl-dolichyl phosphate glucuronosyltransferase [Acidobacteriota bacterium]